MINTFFVPVHLRGLQSHQRARAFRLGTQAKIGCRRRHRLRCGYDDVTWNATAKERLRISKLWHENALVSQRDWLRLDHERSGSISI